MLEQGVEVVVLGVVVLAVGEQHDGVDAGRVVAGLDGVVRGAGDGVERRTGGRYEVADGRRHLLPLGADSSYGHQIEVVAGRSVADLGGEDAQTDLVVALELIESGYGRALGQLEFGVGPALYGCVAHRA